MRRLLSIFMVVCLFNVSIQGAVADLHQVATPPLPHHSISVPVEPDHDLNTMTDRVLAKISATCLTLKDYITTAVHHPIGMTLTAMSAVIVGFYGLLCLGLLVGSLMTDQPFAVSHTLLWGGSPTSFGLLDTCQSPYVPTEHARAFADYEHLTQGSLPLTEVIPIWLNNAQHLLTLLGGIALQLRHGDHSNAVMDRWAMFQENASTFLRAHGMPLRANNISCDLLLGDGTDQHPDQLLQCQYESPPEDFDDAEVSPGAHAKLWLVKWWRHFFGKDSVQLVTAPRPREVRYAQLDMSPDYMNVNHELRTDSRRRLLQLGNVLSLPEAIKSWHENVEHWLDQAYAMADALRHRMCPEIDVPNGLNNLTQRIFDAHQAVMNNGTVRCDADLSNNRFEITACQFDKTPTEYNHELRCDNNAHVQFPGESAIWMIPNTENLYKTFLMVSRHVQPTPAPTPQPTQAPTLPATTDVPTTLEPTTAAPTTSQPTTYAPTDVPTTAAPTPQPTTVAPARNTTTRLYWANPNSYEIWMFNVTDKVIDTPLRAFPTIISRFYALDFVENTIYYSTISNDNSGGLYKTGFNRSNIDNPIDSSQFRSLRGGNAPLVNSMSICPNHDCIFWTEMNNGLFYGKLNITAQEPITNITNLFSPKSLAGTNLIVGRSFVGLSVNYDTQDIIWGYNSAPTAIYRNRYSFFPNKTIYLTDYQETLWQPNTTTTNAIGYLISLSVNSINQKIFIRTDRGNIFYSDLYQQQNVSSLRLLRSHTDEYPILTEGGILIYE